MFLPALCGGEAERTTLSLAGGFTDRIQYLRREQPHGMVSTLSRANIVALLARKLTARPHRLMVMAG